MSDFPRDLLLENRVKTYYEYDAMNNAARIVVSALLLIFYLTEDENSFFFSFYWTFSEPNMSCGAEEKKAGKLYENLFVNI